MDTVDQVMGCVDRIIAGKNDTIIEKNNTIKRLEAKIFILERDLIRKD